MKQWIQSRLAWIDSQFLPPPSFALKEGAIEPGSSLGIGVRSGRILYTLNNTDPRVPGGGVSPAAHIYSGSLAIKENTHLIARAYAGNTWSSPAAATFTIRKPQ